MIKIIGISGISGAGKTTLTKAVGDVLKATTLFWDEYDEISTAPSDYVKWYHDSRDYAEWQYDALANTLKALKAGKKVTCPATKRELIPTDFIIFDAPLGYKHLATGQYIDFLVFLDTPLDIALSRRLIRDYQEKPPSSKNEILEELDHYLRLSRPLYLLADGIKEDAELVINGGLPIEDQLRFILSALKIS